MKRRDFIKTAGLVGASTLVLSNQLFAETSIESKPTNIVLILADDLGYETLSAYGGESYKTPVLDKLAKTGVRFEHCYAQPICTPSRVKLMSGISNVRNYEKFTFLPSEVTTFGNLLQKNKYETCVAGKWQLARDPNHAGFSQFALHSYKGKGSRYASAVININGEKKGANLGWYGPDIATNFILDFIDKNKKKPFFVYYPMILTHCPFEPTPDSKDWNPNSKGSKSYKGDHKYFGDMVEYMDKCIGKIITKLEKENLIDNTLIIFVGDNGTDNPVVSKLNGKMVAGGKSLTTDAGTRVPLIINWGKNIEKPIVCNDIVDLSDFLPTICEATKTKVPKELNIDGRSFLPQIMGQKGNPRDWIYSWYNGIKKPNEITIFARNQRYKLYSTGEFHDIKNDVLEKSPLAESSITPETKKIKIMLQGAIDEYKDARPANLIRKMQARQKKGKKKKVRKKKG